MKVVSPYRPFAQDSPAHRKLGPFDWPMALLMLATSVARNCHALTYALTDVDTTLPVPMHQYVTTERHLMTWILEVSVRYLDSADFDRDTVMVSPDALVFRDLRPWFTADLGLVVRFAPKYVERPLLNGAQWWRHSAKAPLVRAYRHALELAQTYPEASQRWGADTEALLEQFGPLTPGTWVRDDLLVRSLPAPDVMQAITAADMRRLDAGAPVPWPTIPIVDFKYLRKRYLPAYYAATIGAVRA